MRPTTTTATFVLLATLGCGSAAETTAPTGAHGEGSGSETVGAAPRTIEEAVASAERTETNRVRDRYRHPAETLAFFGVRRDMTVLELAPGPGWYTEILAPFLREQGHLVVAIPSASSPNVHRVEGRTALLQQLADRRALFGDVTTVTLSTPEEIDLGPDGSVDAVVTFRNLHNWVIDERVDEVLAAVFRVLRPGGVLGIVDHRAAAGADPAAGTGYLPEAWAIERVQAAGFVLEESSEINANPSDTHDHPNGVWSLPPTLRGGDVDRERFVAIGESDRMTLRFRKPAE